MTSDATMVGLLHTQPIVFWLDLRSLYRREDVPGTAGLGKSWLAVETMGPGWEPTILAKWKYCQEAFQRLISISRSGLLSASQRLITGKGA